MNKVSADGNEVSANVDGAESLTDVDLLDKLAEALIRQIVYEGVSKDYMSIGSSTERRRDRETASSTTGRWCKRCAAS